MYAGPLDEPRLQILEQGIPLGMDSRPTRWKELWARRKSTILWSAVSVMAIVLAVVVGVHVLSGATNPPHHFSFTFSAPACGCVKVTQTTYAFPTQATIDFSWWVTWIGNNGTAQMAIATASGTDVFIAVSEFQQGNPFDPNTTWAQGGAGTFLGKGSPFTFAVEIVTLDYFLPPDTTIWVNGTYTTPLL